MGHPNSSITFGIPRRSSDNRLWTRYPQGDAPNAGSPQGLGGSVSASASTGSASGGTAPGEWADAYITNTSAIGAQLATNGRKVGIRVGSSFTGLSQQLTAGNGATMDIVPGGSFDGTENAVRMYPPTTLVGGQGQYACWLRFLDIWNGGANNIYQMNFSVLVYYGPRYYDLAPSAKCWGFQMSNTLGSGQNGRLGVFDNRDTAWTQWKYPYPTVTTVSSYHEPESGIFINTGPDSNKLISIRNAADHSSSPPATAGEWVHYEDMFDLRRDRGNPDGIHRLRIRTRDRVINRFNDIPLSWDAGWDFSRVYAWTFEGLGFYFNTVGTAHVDNYIMYSHATFAANMGINDLIGPPPGFLL